MLSIHVHELKPSRNYEQSSSIIRLKSWRSDGYGEPYLMSDTYGKAHRSINACHDACVLSTVNVLESIPCSTTATHLCSMQRWNNKAKLTLNVWGINYSPRNQLCIWTRVKSFSRKRNEANKTREFQRETYSTSSTDECGLSKFIGQTSFPLRNFTEGNTLCYRTNIIADVTVIT